MDNKMINESKELLPFVSRPSETNNVQRNASKKREISISFVSKKGAKVK
jgi:hypothetical protein